MSQKYKLKDWLTLTRPYQGAKERKSWWQVVNSFVPFVALWALAYFALQISFWLMLPVTILASLFVVRIFIIQHDCGHGSFFKNKKLQDEVGFLCGIISLTAYEDWKLDHSIHHAHSGDLDHRDIGEIETLTVDEYFHMSRFGRILYRIKRNPFFLFLVAPFLLFAIRQRFPKHHNRKTWKAHLSVVQTNFGIIAIALWLSWLVGWKAFLLIQLPITYFASCLGVWLFYVQHQFEDGYWFYKPEWNQVQSALHGSSYFKLPKILQWFTGNIGFHHIHHLSPQIPNYELERCHKENPIFDQEVTTLTLRNCWQTMHLRFWDEEKEKLVSAGELRKSYRPKFESIRNAVRMLQSKKSKLAQEIGELKKRFEIHNKKYQPKCEIEYKLVRNQIKTLNRLIKRKSQPKPEQIKKYQQEIENLKMLIRKYFPRFS